MPARGPRSAHGSVRGRGSRSHVVVWPCPGATSTHNVDAIADAASFSVADAANEHADAFACRVTNCVTNFSDANVDAVAVIIAKSLIIAGANGRDEHGRNGHEHGADGDEWR